MASIEIQKITQGLIDGQISVTKADRLIEAEFQSRVNAISDDEMLKEKSTYRFHKHMVDYEMGLNEGFENGYDWTKKELIEQ